MMVESSRIRTPFGTNDLTVSRVSDSGAESISPIRTNLVKPSAAVLSALPVIAVSASKRRFGIVCLSPRLTVIHASLHCLHRRQSRVSQMATIREAIERVFEATASPTVVIEDVRGMRRSLSLGTSAFVAWVESLGACAIHVSCAHACYEICGSTDLRATARRIATRYALLEKEILNDQGELCLPYDRWQLRKPLIAAFVLAHAFAAKTVVDAFGGQAPPQSHL